MNTIIVFKTVHAATIDIVYDENDFSKQEMIFRQFGSTATKVLVSTKVDEDVELFFDDGGKILRTIGHFCGSNLIDLTLRNLKIQLSAKNHSAKNRNEIRNVLAALEKLKLTLVCIKGNFLVYAQALQELVIHSCCYLHQLPEVTTLPQLKTLDIGARPFWPFIPGDSFHEFLRKNPSIEKIDYGFVHMNEGHLEAMCSLPKLSDLKRIMIEYDPDEFSLIANARSLKKLQLCVDPDDRDRFLNSRNILPIGCEYSVEPLEIIAHHL